MKIRLSSKSDATAIADIIKRHFESDYMGFANFDDKYIRGKMKKDAFFVAENGGKIVGCARISFVDIDLADIRTLCVDKEYRKQGIAQRFLDESMKLLKEKSLQKEYYVKIYQTKFYYQQ